jgi:hypothetical protein
LEHPLNESQIYLGLAAAGDAVENERTEVSKGRPDRVDRRLLFIPKRRAGSPDGEPSFATR